MKEKPQKIKIIGIRELKFFYIIAWIIKYCIKNGKNPAILSKLNPGLPNGGKSTLPKSYIYNYFTEKNPIAKKYFLEITELPQDIEWKKAREKLKRYKKKKLIFKPDIGIRSIGVIIATDEETRKKLLTKRGKRDYIAQEYINHPYELGVFYYRYPAWSKGKILGIAERDIEHIADPGDSEQYTDRPDLITKKVTDIFNKIIGDKEIYFCRFDIKVKKLEEFSKGKGFKILEANAGPEAVALHALDKRYPWKKQLRKYSEEYIHAFNISEYNKNNNKDKKQIGLIRYLWFLISDQASLQILRFRLRRIAQKNHP